MHAYAYAECQLDPIIGQAVLFSKQKKEGIGLSQKRLLLDFQGLTCAACPDLLINDGCKHSFIYVIRVVGPSMTI